MARGTSRCAIPWFSLDTVHEGEGNAAEKVFLRFCSAQVQANGLQNSFFSLPVLFAFFDLCLLITPEVPEFFLKQQQQQTRIPQISSIIG